MLPKNADFYDHIFWFPNFEKAAESVSSGIARGTGTDNSPKHKIAVAVSKRKDSAKLYKNGMNACLPNLNARSNVLNAFAEKTCLLSFQPECPTQHAERAHTKPACLPACVLFVFLLLRVVVKECAPLLVF